MSREVVAKEAPGQVAALLRTAGLRVTPQRQLIVEVLADAGLQHLTADEVFREVTGHYNGFNRSTVYRILDLLTSAGVVSQHHLGGAVTHFELTRDGVHHHLICVECHGVFELETSELTDLSTRVRRRLGFAIGGIAVAVEGQCATCLGRATG